MSDFVSSSSAASSMASSVLAAFPVIHARADAMVCFRATRQISGRIFYPGVVVELDDDDVFSAALSEDDLLLQVENIYAATLRDIQNL